MSSDNLSAERVLGVIPGLCNTMTRDDSIRCLMGKGGTMEQQAVISLLRYMREDAIRCGVDPDLTERKAGFYSGEVNALAQLEEWLLNIYGMGMGKDGEE